MKQQINLYLPEFRIKKDTLTFGLMARITAGMVLGLALLSGYDLFTRWRLGGELVELRMQLQEETRKNQELQQVLARRSQNAALTQRLELAEARLLASRQIRDFLTDTQLGNVEGFSEFFKDLSRASIDGLSINEFEIDAGGRRVRLAGDVMDSVLVPRFVDNIRNGQSELRSQQFSPQISRQSAGQDYFSFVLSTSNE